MKKKVNVRNFVLLWLCLMCILNSCTQKSIKGVNLYIDEYKDLLGGDKDPFVQNIVHAKFYEDDEEIELIPCIENATILSGNGKLTDDEINYYTSRKEKNLVAAPLTYKTNIIVLSPKGDTLLKYINIDEHETEIITYSKLYSSLANREDNPMYLHVMGDVAFSTEPGCMHYWLIKGKIREYDIIPGSGNIYCKRETEEGDYQTSESDNSIMETQVTKWEEFAGTTYKASQFTSEGYQYYAFSYDRKWSTLYTKWSPKGTIYISIRMNSIIL